MSAFSFITSDNPEPESAEPSSGFGFIQTAAADDLLSSLESSFGSGAAADVDDAEQVAAAELDAQIASADEAVRALVQKVESLDIQKAAAAQARDFRTASTLSKNLQLAKEEKAVKEMELGMLKAARSSPTAIRARSQSSPSAAEPGDEAEQHVPTTPKVDSDSLATWVEQDGAKAETVAAAAAAAVAGLEAPDLPAGWELLPSKDYPGRSFYYHAATDSSQWHAPPNEVTPDTAQGGGAADTSGDAASAQLTQERELREAAEARARTAEQEVVVLESKLREEMSAAAENRMARQAAEVVAEQEKTSAAAAAHQAGVLEGRAQMDEQMQELQERVQASDAAVRVAQEELAAAKAEAAKTVTECHGEVAAARDKAAAELESERQARFKAIQEAEATAQDLRRELEAMKVASAAAPPPEEYTESDSDDEDAETKPPNDLDVTALTAVQQQLDDANATLTQAQADFEAKLTLAEKAKQQIEHDHDDMVLEHMKLKTQVQTLNEQLEAARTHESSGGGGSSEISLDLELELTLTDPGPLGLRFSRNKRTGGTVVQGMNDGSQAAKHASADKIYPGLVLVTVAGQDMRGKDYKTVLAACRGGVRPLTLGFVQPEPEDRQQTVEATFTQQGSLGLKFSPEKLTGRAELVGITKGTQAEEHPQLLPGMFLEAIAGGAVVGKPYKEVLGMIKQAGRPLTLTFLPEETKATAAATAAASAVPKAADGMRVMIPRGQWGELAKERELKQKAEARAKSLEAASLRLRAELVALQQGQSGSSSDASFAVTFVETGSLGLVFTANRHTGQAEIMVIKDGTQAKQHKQLSVGATLTSIGGTSVSGKSYNEVIGLVRAGGRPLEMTFVSGVPSVASPRAGDGTTPRARSPRTESSSLAALEVEELENERARRETAETRAKSLEEIALRLRSELTAADQKMKQQAVDLEKALVRGREAAEASSPRAFEEDGVTEDDRLRMKVAAGKILPSEAQAARRTDSSLSKDEQESGTVAATFTEAGSLGMRFGKRPGNRVELVHINPNSQATNHPQLQPGLVVQTVRGVTCINKPFKEVLAMIKLPERPFHITFTWPTVATISVNFTKPGSLGLKFTHNRETDEVEILQINPGTQAEAHPQLAPGLILQSVGNQSVKGISYADTIALIVSSGRPLPMTFTYGGTVASSPRGTRAVERQGGMRVVVPRGEWKDTAAAKVALKLQQDEEQEVARSPRTADRPNRLEFFTPPATPTGQTADRLEDKAVIEAKVAEARAEASAEASRVADAALAKARKDGDDQLRQLQQEHTAASNRYQAMVEAEQASHRSTRDELETLKQEHNSSAVAQRAVDEELTESSQETEAAKYRAKLQSLSDEMERQQKLHAAELVAAAQLESRWRESVREAQRKRRELSPRLRATVSGDEGAPEEHEYGHAGDEEDIFVCYLCQKGVTNL